MNARGELVTLSEATVTVDVGAETMIVAGQRPGHALDTALRKALVPTYPELERHGLVDYKVRILTPEAAPTPHARDDRERRCRRQAWSTVGVSTNIIDASFDALGDAITYKLFVDGAEAAGSWPDHRSRREDQRLP